MDKVMKTALLSLLFNMVFGVYHIIFGVIMSSWWLFTVGIYYAVLSIIRFVVLLSKRQARFMARFTGAMLMILSLPLTGTVILSLAENRGNKLHKTLMIAMAAYAFAKIAFAMINLRKSRKSGVGKHIILRNISFADSCVSIFTLQRSMLVSFGKLSANAIYAFNALLGAAVCIVVFMLGLHLVRNKKTNFIAFSDSIR